MNLIISASLSENPPSDPLFFRYLTLAAHTSLYLDCLLETEQEMKDNYYRFLLKQGLFDYIEEIITIPENESGIRLATELNFPLTIKTKAIRSDNVINLLGQIKSLSLLEFQTYSN